MGRPRTKNFDLPPKVRRKGNALYYVVADGGNVLWLRLGSDRDLALKRAAALAEKYATDSQDPAMRDRVRNQGD